MQFKNCILSYEVFQKHIKRLVAEYWLEIDKKKLSNN